MSPADGPRTAPVVYGVHPVLEVLEARPGEVDRVLVARGAAGRGLGRVLRTARESGVPISHVPRETLARRAGRSATHQGVVAIVAAAPYADADDLLRAARAGGAGLLVALDGVEDPRNLGAIVRTAGAVGVDGVLLATDSTVGLTPAALKASAGVAARVPVARAAKIPAILGALGEVGFRSVALDPHAESAWHAVDLTGPVVLVAGGEGRGLRPGVVRSCTDRVSIPLVPGVDSLNVSVAVAVVLFEVVRQRGTGKNLEGGS